MSSGPTLPMSLISCESSVDTFYAEDADVLVLTRKLGDMVVIGDEIRIEVLSMKGGRVSLGITAPGNVDVLRLGISGAVDPSHPADDCSSTSNID